MKETYTQQLDEALNRVARNTLRDLLKQHNVSIAELSRRLCATQAGQIVVNKSSPEQIKETSKISMKIKGGKYNLAFFMECLEALGIASFSLDINDIKKHLDIYLDEGNSQ